MKKLNYAIVALFFIVGMSACGQNQNHEEANELQLSSLQKGGSFNACKGITENNFRETFNIPSDYVLGDVEAFNVMPEMSCVMAAGKDGKQLAIMVSMMANPSTYDFVATRVKEEFSTAPEEDKIKGLGEFAIYRENRTRKESALVVFQDKHIISIAFDHSNTYEKEQLKEMMQNFYKKWLKLQS
ncbi:hypothetical protein [Mongoliitalea lutea]|uniref:DUF1795 domain-containing protein n=1 Tax=Mongoliitalea lutea TaxID=849756 RepID=A0A8J3G3U8_9BACT|nr:hypothetical protein [Mongoliitalea lutea]GHB25646.1 hypothetical protein GCM10008106_03030 [Mongoliitalea lutea]